MGIDPGWYVDSEQPDPINQWEKWFAWHPVIIDNRIYWLKSVYRSSYRYPAGISNKGPYTYGTILDVLKDKQ